MTEWLFTPAFALWGAPATWLELVAVALALAMVWFNIREIHWAWPLAIASSLLYLLLFAHHRLYGEAGLQVVFATVALWGWFQWLRGRRADGSALRVAALAPAARAAWTAVGLVLWLLLGLLLAGRTDSDVPWWDAFPTAFSLVGQFLLGRKYIENWAVWIVVNVVSVALFAYKGLWLTVLLYTVFIALSFVGWRAWRSRLPAAAR